MARGAGCCTTLLYHGPSSCGSSCGRGECTQFRASPACCISEVELPFTHCMTWNLTFAPVVWAGRQVMAVSCCCMGPVRAADNTGMLVSEQNLLSIFR